MRKYIAVFFMLTICIISESLLATPYALPTFQTAEHIAAGDEVRLTYAKNEPSKTQPTLPLENGLVLGYGDVMALADFYGDINAPISSAATAQERTQRFIAAFSSLATEYTSIGEVRKILAVIAKEKTAIQEGIKNGEKPETVYQRISGDLNREYNCATGGNCGVLWFLFPGKYLKLASNDRDHFGDNAWLSYEAGHRAALQVALAAHKTQDTRLLTRAYAMNAFASHYLSDRFSSGHVRMPHVALHTQVTPSVLGALLSKFMHDEESVYGLSVHNQRGNYWLLYGDGYYFAKQNQDNARILIAALQASADEIFYAFNSGKLPTHDYVSDYLPIANESATTSHYDLTPLFYWDDATKTLYRRLDITNPYDKRLTANWWGWTTVIQLVRERGLSVEWQASIALSGYGKLGIKYGLITDKDVIHYVKHHG